MNDDVIVAPKKMLSKLNEMTQVYTKPRGASAASGAFRFGGSAAGKANIKKVLEDESSEELVSPFFENEWGRGAQELVNNHSFTTHNSRVQE